MGLFGNLTKSNFDKSRLDTASISLLFISLYQTFSLVSQGFYWQSILFILAGGGQFYYLINSQNKKFSLRVAMFCITVFWVAILSSNSVRQGWELDWLFILIPCAYLLLNLKAANIINVTGLIVLQAVFYTDDYFTNGTARLLPFFVLMVIANMLATQHVYLKSALKRSQTHDALTGCVNRVCFQHEIIKASDICRRYQINMSMISLQINEPSKQIALLGNERFDQYLTSLAQVWSSRLRNTDILCRYSDGIFIVLLPSTVLESALLLADELVKSSKDYDFNLQNNIQIRSKTMTHDGTESWEDWLNRTVL